MIRWLLLLPLLLSLPVQAATRLTLSPGPYRQEQSLQLTVISDGELPAEALDIKPLFANFVIGQLRWQTDPQAQTTVWTIPLIPRLSGRVTLPPLRVGHDLTAAQALPIAPPPSQQAAGLANQAARLQGRLDTDQALVGQPLLYEARIWMHPGVQMANLTAPSLEGARITAIGDDEQLSELIGGQRVLSLQRHYLIVPEVPGQVRLYGAQAQGEELEDAQGLQLRPRPVHLQAPDRDLQVTALPAGAPELVADEVRLSQRWEPAQGPYRQGDPIVRVVTLELLQADPRRVPTLGLPQQTGLRSYDDGQQSQISLQEGRLRIQQTLRQALIPVAGGDLTLPAIEIPWWDARHQRQETASLPATTLAILAQPTQPAADRKETAAPAVYWLAGLLPPLLVLWWWLRRDHWPRLRWLALGWHSLRLLYVSRQPDACRQHAQLLTWARWRWPDAPPSGVETLPCYAALSAQLDPLLAACFASPAGEYHWPAKLTWRLLTWRGSAIQHAAGLNPGALD